MGFKVFRPGANKNKLPIKALPSQPVTIPSNNQNTGVGNVLIPVNSSIVTKTWTTVPYGNGNTNTWITGNGGNVSAPVVNLDVEPADDRDGCVCNRCKEFYPFATPNQPDGRTLVCFSCRNGY